MPYSARSKNFDFPLFFVAGGKSSANITTLSLIKKQLKHFFTKKLIFFYFSPTPIYIRGVALPDNPLAVQISAPQHYSPSAITTNNTTKKSPTHSGSDFAK